MVSCLIIMYVIVSVIFSRFSHNSEENASELQENLKEFIIMKSLDTTNIISCVKISPFPEDKNICSFFLVSTKPIFRIVFSHLY